jgi:DNA-binding transcriptional LysR family regulator
LRPAECWLVSIVQSPGCAAERPRQQQNQKQHADVSVSPGIDALDLPAHSGGCCRAYRRFQLWRFDRSQLSGAFFMDRLKALATFKAVVDKGGFSRAASGLNLSCGQVTRAVQELESVLGVRLLQRTTRHLSLTSAGEEVLHRAATLLESYAELVAASKQHADGVNGVIRLAAPASLGRWLISRSLIGFMTNHPGVQVQLRTDSGPMDLCQAKDDLALCRTQDLRPSLIARRIASCCVALYASPHYLARRGMPQTPAELASHACLGAEDEPSRSWRLREMGCSEYLSVLVQRTLETGHAELTVEAAERGAGIALLPALVAEASLQGQRLQQVLPQWGAEPLELHLAYHSRKNQPVAVRLLIQHLVNSLSVSSAGALPTFTKDVVTLAPRAPRAARGRDSAPSLAA